MSNTFNIGNLMSFICPVVSHFPLKCCKIHVNNTAKPTFLILTESLSPNCALIRWNLNTSQKPKKKTKLSLLRDTYPNAAIWLVGDTYPKRSYCCEQHTTLYANIKLLEKKKLKNDNHRLKMNYRPVSLLTSFSKIRKKVVLFHLYNLLMDIN